MTELLCEITGHIQPGAPIQSPLSARGWCYGHRGYVRFDIRRTVTSALGVVRALGRCPQCNQRMRSTIGRP